MSQRGQPALHRNECGPRITLVGKEEQARIETAETVTAIDEVVAAAQQVRPRVLVRVRESDVTVDVHERGALGPDRGEVGRDELGPAGERSAFALGAPDDRLLLDQRGAVPGLDRHPDPTRHQIAATRHPRAAVGRRGPHVLREQIAVLGLDVGRAVGSAPA